MRLVNTYYNIEMNIVENQVIVLSIENQTAYANVVGDLWRQVQGEEGSFVLSENDKIKNLSKEMEVIFNPFSLDCNSKKIISRLYQEMKAQSDNILQEETAELNGIIMRFLDKVIMTVPYAVKYNCDMDILNVFKMYDVEIDIQTETLLESIIEYIKTVSGICQIDTFVFIDLKRYLTTEELKQLYEFAFYNKINILIIEPVHSEECVGEKCWILDKDLCIIEL